MLNRFQVNLRLPILLRRAPNFSEKMRADAAGKHAQEREGQRDGRLGFEKS
jgi:hypothetical protein